jgi:hypothetical protein
MSTLNVSSPALCITAGTNLSLNWLTFLADTVTCTSHHSVSFTMPLFTSKAHLTSAQFYWASYAASLISSSPFVYCAPHLWSLDSIVLWNVDGASPRQDLCDLLDLSKLTMRHRFHVGALVGTSNNDPKMWETVTIRNLKLGFYFGSNAVWINMFVVSNQN